MYKIKFDRVMNPVSGETHNIATGILETPHGFFKTWQDAEDYICMRTMSIRASASWEMAQIGQGAFLERALVRARAARERLVARGYTVISRDILMPREKSVEPVQHIPVQARLENLAAHYGLSAKAACSRGQIKVKIAENSGKFRGQKVISGFTYNEVAVKLLLYAGARL